MLIMEDGEIHVDVDCNEINFFSVVGFLVVRDLKGT